MESLRLSNGVYGDVDFIPTEEYDARDAGRAIRDAEFVVLMAGLVIK